MRNKIVVKYSYGTWSVEVLSKSNLIIDAYDDYQTREEANSMAGRIVSRMLNDAPDSLTVVISD